MRSARDRRPWLDHGFRAFDRHSEVQGGQLAASITYFGFLSFFPLMALAFALVGYVSDVYPQAQEGVTSAVEGAFPSLIGSGEGQLDIQDVIDARTGAGLIGLIGLLYAGLGWLDAMRDALHRVFGTLEEILGLVAKKLWDVIVLGMLGLSLLASVVVSSLATAATTYALGSVGLDDSTTATIVLKVLSVVLAFGVDVLVISILLSRLSGARLPWQRVRSGAVLGAVGFEVLKLLGTFLIGRTTQNPLYATFGVVVGLLVWINFASRLLVLAAAWTATQPYSVRPGLLSDYEAVPVEADVGSSSRSSWPSLAVGIGLGAAAAAVVTRRRASRTRS